MRGPVLGRGGGGVRCAGPGPWTENTTANSAAHLRCSRPECGSSQQHRWCYHLVHRKRPGQATTNRQRASSACCLWVENHKKAQDAASCFLSLPSPLLLLLLMRRGFPIPWMLLAFLVWWLVNLYLFPPKSKEPQAASGQH